MLFRNIYDTSTTVWHPKGKILQVQYAKEAVKQGMTSLGLKSKTHVALVSLKRHPFDLASHQEKIFQVDDHLGIAIAGLTADARTLCKYMRDECLNYWYVHDSQHPVARLVAKIGEKSQQRTMNGRDRPYGVGILCGGVDSAGTHLFETSPSGEYFEYYAMAIGARSQSAKTYLEKNFESFGDCSRDELIKHGINALRASAQEVDLSEHNVSIGIVGEGEEFKRLSEEEIKGFLAEQEGGDVEMIEA